MSAQSFAVRAVAVLHVVWTALVILKIAGVIDWVNTSVLAGGFLVLFLVLLVLRELDTPGADESRREIQSEREREIQDEATIREAGRGTSQF